MDFIVEEDPFDKIKGIHDRQLKALTEMLEEKDRIIKQQQELLVFKEAIIKSLEEKFLKC